MKFPFKFSWPAAMAGFLVAVGMTIAINNPNSILHANKIDLEQERIHVVEKPYNFNPKLGLAIVSVDGKEFLVSYQGGIAPLDSKP